MSGHPNATPIQPKQYDAGELQREARRILTAIDYKEPARDTRGGLEHIFAPIGFNWQISIALVPGMAAREVAVGALGTVYSLSVTARRAVQSESLPGEMTRTNVQT